MISQMEGPKREPLTPRQQAVYQCILEENRRGNMPAIVEIGERLGIRSFQGVRGHLSALEKKGYITRTPNQARSIRVVGHVEELCVELEPGQSVELGTLRAECVGIVKGRAQVVISRSF